MTYLVRINGQHYGPFDTADAAAKWGSGWCDPDRIIYEIVPVRAPPKLAPVQKAV